MPDTDPKKAILAAMRSERRVGQHFALDMLELDADGTLTLAGEVPEVAVKKLALRLAAAHPGVHRVVDRLRVAPSEHMSDAGIRERLRHYFGEEPSFQGYAIREAEDSGPDPAFHPVAGDTEEAIWRIDYEVRDGVTILNGKVPGLVSKRLAGAMAWWVPGVRDVVNGLETPDEEDAPIRIEEAVRIVLDRDPYIEDSQVRVGVRLGTVRLTGLLPSAAQRDMAERDAWCVIGVDDVENRIEVRR